jgi:hypothetical protein
MTEETIPVIDQFLAEWKKKAFSFYRGVCDEYLKRRKDEAVWCEKWNSAFKYPNHAEIRNECDTHFKEFHTWERININVLHVVRGYIPADWDKAINNALDKEVIRKKRALINRIKYVTGDIIDASGLYIGVNTDINGIVIGLDSKAKVTTIYAGGYNIQCLHYRVLIHQMKAS